MQASKPTPQPLRGISKLDTSPSVGLPAYDRSSLEASIVHFGVGGFHRAHLATYVDELCAAGHTDWAITGVGVLPGDARMADALGPQNGLYTLITRGASETDVQIIGSIVDYVHIDVPGGGDPAPVLDLLADPKVQLVSLTITEGGYPVDDETGKYDANSAVAGAGSVFSLLARGLDRRRATHGQPLTVLSCDNIMSNGDAARNSTIGEAHSIDAELAEWIDQHIGFPNSMVDRITPSTSETDRAWLADTHGLDDAWPVVTEPFRQWVIEDHFTGARLPLEELDIIVTDDVAPYEIVKLRLLNAGHSCLAYLAALDGIETVDAAMADPAIRQFLEAFLVREAKPVVPEVAGIDTDDYIATLLERFANPSIGDQIARLCLDGSAKFPKFLMPTVSAQIAAGGPVELAALALAAWCRYLRGVDDHGNPIEVSGDPRLAEAVQYAKDSVKEPTAFLDFDGVFPAAVRESERFRNCFGQALESLDAAMRPAIAQAIDRATTE